MGQAWESIYIGADECDKLNEEKKGEFEFHHPKSRWHEYKPFFGEGDIVFGIDVIDTAEKCSHQVHTNNSGYGGQLCKYLRLTLSSTLKVKCKMKHLFQMQLKITEKWEIYISGFSISTTRC